MLPAGTAKIGDREYVVQLNSSPPTVEGLEPDAAARPSTARLSIMQDVAQVRDGYHGADQHRARQWHAAPRC